MFNYSNCFQAIITSTRTFGSLSRSFIIVSLLLISNQLLANTIDIKARYGLTGDGVTDNLPGLTNAVNENPGKDLLLKDGIFAISDTWTLPPNTRLKAKNAVLLYAKQSQNAGDKVVISNSNTTITNLRIDGGLLASYGIWIQANSDNVTINDIEIYDLKGSANSGAVQGIRATSGSRNVNINRANIHHLYAYENGIQGDSVGSVRAIYIGESYNIQVSDCILHNIQGYEDGDAIHVQAETRLLLNVVIDNCQIYNFGKRAIKIQASGVTVKNNNILSSNMDFIDQTYVLPNDTILGVASGIDFLNGSWNTIINNNINLYAASWPISISGSDNITVANNYASIYRLLSIPDELPRVRLSFIRSLYLYNSINCTITGNTFSTALAGMHIRNSTNNLIKDNIVGFDTKRYAPGTIYDIYWEEASSKNTFINNTLLH